MFRCAPSKAALAIAVSLSTFGVELRAQAGEGAQMQPSDGLRQGLPCSGFCWDAPPGCPTQAQVEARIARLSAGKAELSRANTRATVTQVEVTQGDPLWRLLLSHNDDSRVIEADDCVDLLEATAVAVVLSSTSDAGGEQAPLPPESGEEPEPAKGEGEREEALGPGVYSTTTLDVPDFQRDTPTTGGAKRPDSAPAAIAGFVELEALFDARLLGAASLGARLGAGLAFNDATRLAVYGELLLSERQQLDDLEAVSVDQGYLAAGLMACHTPLGPGARLEACALAENGWLSAQASPLFDSTPQLSIFPSLGFAARVLPAVGDQRLVAEIQALLPLWRDRFTLDRGQRDVGEVPAWTVRAAVGGMISVF